MYDNVMMYVSYHHHYHSLYYYIIIVNDYESFTQNKKTYLSVNFLLIVGSIGYKVQADTH